MDQDYLITWLKKEIEQLDARLTTRLGDLGEQIEGLRYEQETAASAMLARLDAHEDYHRGNEHRWGLCKLAGRYPFRLAALAVVAAVGGTSLGAAERVMQWVLQLARLIQF